MKWLYLINVVLKGCTLHIWPHVGIAKMQERGCSFHPFSNLFTSFICLFTILQKTTPSQTHFVFKWNIPDNLQLKWVLFLISHDFAVDCLVKEGLISIYLSLIVRQNFSFTYHFSNLLQRPTSISVVVPCLVRIGPLQQHIVWKSKSKIVVLSYSNNNTQQ